MCVNTRFTEAIPLRNIKTPKIKKALEKFFTTFGFPRSLQSYQGSKFMSKEFQQFSNNLFILGIKQEHSSAYHPESQDALERFHQTLKTMMKTYCYENDRDRNEGIPSLLFAIRESVQESLGFSPNKMQMYFNS